MKTKMFDLWILREYYKTRIQERFLLWFVWKIPKVLIKWAAIRLITNATTGEYGNTVVPELSAMDALTRWN